MKTIDAQFEVLRAYPEAKKSGRHEYLILCHKHRDTRPSLSVNVVKEVWYCLACKAKGRMSSLPRLRYLKVPAKAEAQYVYTDAHRNPICRKVRYPGKRFVWQRAEGDAWKRGLGGEKLEVLYNLPEVLDSEVVLLVEGEKDVENLREANWVATTPPNGAMHWRSAFSEQLRGKVVFVLPDNDDVGRQHAAEAIKHLWGFAKEIRYAPIDGFEGADVSDILAEMDGRMRLDQIIGGARIVGRGAAAFSIQDFVDLALRDSGLSPRSHRVAVASLLNAFRSRSQRTLYLSQARHCDETGLHPPELRAALRQAEKLRYWKLQTSPVGTVLTVSWQNLESRLLSLLPRELVPARQVE